MKVGERLPVNIQGVVVTEAVIVDLDTDTVTVQIQGVEAVIGLTHSLTDETPERAPEVDRVLLDTPEGGTKATNDTRTYVEPEPTRSLKEMDLDSSGVD